MSAPDTSAPDPAHDPGLDVALDLVALANGTADAAVRARAEAALAADPRLAAEHAALLRVREAVKAPDGSPPGEFGWQRLQRAIAQERLAAHAAALPRWRLGAIAASVVAGGLALGLSAQLATRDTGRFVPAGETLRDARVVFQVTFAPGAREAEIRALLRAARVRIVDGPSALGVYRLAADPAWSAEAQATLAAAAIIESLDRE